MQTCLEHKAEVCEPCAYERGVRAEKKRILDLIFERVLGAGYNAEGAAVLDALDLLKTDVENTDA